MNPLIAEARTTVDGMWIMGITTLAFLVFFVGWIAWAWWPSRRDAMDRAAMMPFDDDFTPETSPRASEHGAAR